MNNINLNKIEPAYKIIADHLRSCAFLIADGVMPSNEGRGYVLRRIMRRAMLYIHKLNAKEPVMYKLVPILINEMGDAYPELERAKELITDSLKIEEERFKSTIDRGIEILNEELLKISGNQKFSGTIAFKLYDTYGFPLDLTENILKEKDIEVDLEEFEKEMQIQKIRAKESWSGSGSAKDSDLHFKLKEKYGSTKFLGYSTTKSLCNIIAIIKDGEEVSEVKAGDQNVEIILNQSPFYATSGGQKGDDGNIILSSEYDSRILIDYKRLHNVIDISETKKYAGDLFSHLVSEIRGKFKTGDAVVALVNNRSRQFRAQNHSATHLLHFVLKEILGKQITQKGSNVDSHYFTFDFNHPKALSQNELDQIEDLVNFYIRQNTPVKTEVLKLEDARKKGAVALFGEKYDDMVRVLSMASNQKHEDLSIEFCGGTHIKATGNIGLFKIISEKGIAAGIRRIEAKTGYFALEHLRLQEKKLNAFLESLKIKQQFDDIKIPDNFFHSPKKGFDDLSFFADENNSASITSSEEISAIQNVCAQIYKLGEEKLNEIKQSTKEIEKLKKEKLLNNLGNFTLEKINGINFIHHIFEETDAKSLRDLITNIKAQKEYQNNSVILFFGNFEEKISVIISVSSDLTDKINAGKLMPSITEKIGGKGGGGKPDLAMGGGVDRNGIKEAISFLRNLFNN